MIRPVLFCGGGVSASGFRFPHAAEKTILQKIEKFQKKAGHAVKIEFEWSRRSQSKRAELELVPASRPGFLNRARCKEE